MLICTGNADLDAALGGGYPAGRITTIVGAPAVTRELVANAITATLDQHRCVVVVTTPGTDMKTETRFGIPVVNVVPVTTHEDTAAALTRVPRDTLLILDDVLTLPSTEDDTHRPCSLVSGFLSRLNHAAHQNGNTVLVVKRPHTTNFNVLTATLSHVSEIVLHATREAVYVAKNRRGEHGQYAAAC